MVLLYAGTVLLAVAPVTGVRAGHGVAPGRGGEEGGHQILNNLNHTLVLSRKAPITQSGWHHTVDLISIDLKMKHRHSGQVLEVGAMETRHKTLAVL